MSGDSAKTANWSRIFAAVSDKNAVFLAANNDHQDGVWDGLVRMVKARPARGVAICNHASKSKAEARVAIYLLPEVWYQDPAYAEALLLKLRKKFFFGEVKKILKHLREQAVKGQYATGFNQLAQKIL